MRRVLVLILLAVLLWSAIGIIIFPEWWYRLAFERRYTDPVYWGLGNYSAFLNTCTYFSPIILTVWAVLAFSKTGLPEYLASTNAKIWSFIATKKGFSYTAIILITVFSIGLCTAGWRSKDSREFEDKLAKSEQDLKATLEKMKTPIETPPLSDPTSFSYIDTQEVESLYGQNEPDLVPALVRKKIESSAHLNLNASIEDYLKTEIGRSQVEQEETELRKTEKNPQRKLRDLIRFLDDQQKLKRYGHRQWKSGDLQKLEEATSLLSKYGVVSDPKKLQSVRDRLLFEEVQRLEGELSVLHGLVLVDGDWVVEKTQESYRFRAPIIEQVSNPLYFEIRIKSEDLSSKTRDVIELYKERSIRLTVFGNVIAGASQKDRSIHVIPIAVY